MAGVGSSVYTYGRVALLSSGLRGLGAENLNVANAVVPRPLANLVGTNSISNSCASSTSSFQRRGMHSLLTPRFDSTTSGAAMVSNSAYFRRSTQLQRQLKPRPWDARRSISTVGGGTPVQASFLGKLFEAVIQFLAKILPTRAVIEQLEADIDVAAGMVQQGAQLVIEIADEVERLSNAAELGAEEVERIATKVEDITEKIKKIVDDVADVLEGEKGASTLVNKVNQLKKVAAARKAKDSDTTATIIAEDESKPS